MQATDEKPVSKQTLYQIASRHSRSAITKLVELTNSSNENVALGACKVLLNKTLPDLKSEQFFGDIKVDAGTSLSEEDAVVRLQEVLRKLKELNITGD
ncbi:MAG TPA: hypothetical protein VF209_02760 [Patescibacteria group bacterium]